MKRKFMLCQYPKEGFGGRNGQFYLLDAFGNKYDIEDEYDKILCEMNKAVIINGSYFYENTIDKLIEAIELELDTKIERW